MGEKRRMMRGSFAVLAVLALASRVWAQTPLLPTVPTDRTIAWDRERITLAFPVGHSSGLTVWNDTSKQQVQGVRNGSQFIAFNIPLAPGLNKLRPVRTPVGSGGGITASKVVLVKRESDVKAAIRVNPEPIFGTSVPFQSTLHVSADLGTEVGQELWVDTNGDGVIDATVPYASSYIATYTAVDRYKPQVTIKTTTGRLYSTIPESTLPITVVSPTSFAVSTLPQIPGTVIDSHLDHAGRKLYVLSAGPFTLTVVSLEAGSAQSYPVLGLSGAFGFGVDMAGNVYIADTGNDRIVKLLQQTSYQPDLSVSPTGSFGSTGAGDGQLNAPRDVAIVHQLAMEYVWVADTGNGRLLRFTPQGGFKKSVTGAGSPSGPFITPRLLFSLNGESLVIHDSGSGFLRHHAINGLELSSLGSFPSPSSVLNVVTDPSTNNLVVLDTQALALKVLRLDGTTVGTIEALPTGQAAHFVVTKPQGRFVYLIAASGGVPVEGQLADDPPGADPVSEAQRLLVALANQDVAQLAARCDDGMWVRLAELLASGPALAAAASAAQGTGGLTLVGMGTLTAEVSGTSGTSATPVMLRFKRDRATGAWRCTGLPWAP